MKSKIFSLDELKSINLSNLDRPLYVSVPYSSNRSHNKYVCKIEPTIQKGQLFISTEIKPKAYHLEGLLYYDEHDPTELGNKVVTFTLNKKGLDIIYGKQSMDYIRKISLDDDIFQSILRFVEDVSKTSPAVDKMILDYLQDKAA